LPALELPTDHARPAQLSDRGGRQSFRLSAEVSGELRRLSRRQGVTLFMTLLTGYRALLSRYSGQAEVMVGTPVAGRQQAEVEGLIGFFVNMVVLRGSLEGDPSVEEMLRREREVTLGAYGHQEVGFERLVEELQPEREMSRAPLFQAMFVLQNVRRERLRLAGLKLSREAVEVETAHYELTLAMADEEGGLRGTMEYSRDLYEAETVRRMVRHYERLLGEMVAGEGRRLSEMEMLDEGERQQLLVGWNGATADYPHTHCVHQLIEQQAERAADRIAVAYEADQVSYAELNGRANQLANCLTRAGVGADVRVGVCMEHGIQMIVALLAVMKAGGTCVPIDPGFPKRRIGLIVEDAELQIILTQERLSAALSEQRARLIRVDQDWSVIEKESERTPDGNVDGENLAYVLYASDASGTPRGAAIPHRGLADAIRDAIGKLQMSDRDSLLQFASLNAETAAVETYMALAIGARLILKNDRLLKPTKRLLDACAESRPTVLALPAAHWYELTQKLASEKVSPPAGLRLVSVGGERVLPELLSVWQAQAEGVRLVNAYGPTEATVAGVIEELHPAGNEAPATEHTADRIRAGLVGRSLELVPVGVTGELVIGGNRLARGYWHKPDLTAERFVPDPFGRESGARLYRTGEVARRRPDATIEYLGRTDSQVMIRQHRIDLREIETALTEHPSVREAAVVVRAESAKPKELIGYVVGKGDPLKVAELATHLRERLPAYMVPSLVALPSLPRRSNGRVDRAALLTAKPSRTEPEAGYLAPRTALEQSITQIWSKVLGIKKLGINDNFFDLGGSSLTLIELSYELKDALGLELSVIELFEHTSISDLAGHLSRKENPDSAMQQIQARASKQREAMSRQRRLAQER
ncbi:MAG TPA: amino acid adenylation domain-containing protein, partial [Blastocatellia bacterium]|nr:amino acid adenylation domain-containing protein [Blastocatellia bacterium]